jgi:hypothetical protein
MIRKSLSNVPSAFLIDFVVPFCLPKPSGGSSTRPSENEPPKQFYRDMIIFNTLAPSSTTPHVRSHISSPPKSMLALSSYVTVCCISGFISVLFHFQKSSACIIACLDLNETLLFNQLVSLESFSRSLTLVYSFTRKYSISYILFIPLRCQARRVQSTGYTDLTFQRLSIFPCGINTSHARPRDFIPHSFTDPCLFMLNAAVGQGGIITFLFISL